MTPNRSSIPQAIPVVMTVYATVIVNDPEPFERVIGAAGDEWRTQFYDLHEIEDVAEHFVYNAVVNGVYDPSGLDGWADIQPGSIRVEIDDIDISAALNE